MLCVRRENDRPSAGRNLIRPLITCVAVALLAGCQIQTVSTVQLEIHQAFVDRCGLSPLHADAPLHVSCAPPSEWDQLPLTANVLYSHQQWRSPDRHVGMGVAYMHTPIAISPQTLIWFAKAQYARSKDGSGHVLGQWTDSLGRCWFEAENKTYHIRGYAMTHGNDAWMVYSGYRVQANPPPTEILLAARGADSVAPIPVTE